MLWSARRAARRRPAAATRSGAAWIRERTLTALCVVAALAVLPAAAQARWSSPFDLAAPGHLDVLGPQLDIAGNGAAAGAFSTEDVDTPGSAAAYLTLRSPAGKVGGPEAVTGVGQILDLAFDGRSLELLTGSNPAGETCCSTVQAIAVGAGGSLGRPRLLVSGLTGATDGRLLTLGDGQMLAAAATEGGVWTVQSVRGDRFGTQHRLTAAGEMPQALAAAWLGKERSIVVWTAARGPAGAADPRSIDGATGSRTSAPRRARTLVTAARGHRIDEIGVAPSGGQKAMIAWIESWDDSHGTHHSVVRALDLMTPHAQARTLSPAGRQASDLQVAGDTGGDQALSWSSCTVNAVCTTEAAVRRARAAIGPARSLGALDPGQAPAVAVGPRGQALVGWVRGGHPVAAAQSAPGRGFGPAVVLSRSRYALNMAVAVGGRRQGLAAWSQGTLNPSVVAAADSGL